MIVAVLGGRAAENALESVSETTRIVESKPCGDVGNRDFGGVGEHTRSALHNNSRNECFGRLPGGFADTAAESLLTD